MIPSSRIAEYGV